MDDDERFDEFRREFRKHITESIPRIMPKEPKDTGTSRNRGPKGAVHAARRRSRRAANKRARTARRRNRG